MNTVMSPSCVPATQVPQAAPPHTWTPGHAAPWQAHGAMETVQLGL